MSKALWGDAGPATDAALDDASALLDTTAAPDGLPVFEVTVYGMPAPQGSKSAKRNRYTGRIQMVESSKAVKPWREAVVVACLRALPPGWTPLTCPVETEMIFTLLRPKSHFGTGRNSRRVRPSAPPLPVSPPDISKLARSTEDALTTAGVYKDDALIVDYRRLRKRYHTDHGRVADVLEAPGCVIRLWPSDPHGGRS